MRTATGLTLVAIGAILALAVRGHPWFLNIQVVGWIVILTGIAGMFVPRRGYGWLRRRMVLRRGPAGRPVVHGVEEKNYPPYIALNPGPVIRGTTVADAGPGPRDDAGAGPPTVVEPPADPARVLHPDAEQRAAERAAAEQRATERAMADWAAAEQAARPGQPRPAEEVIEEYVEE